MVEPSFLFCGRYEHALDEKGRLMLPGPLRDELRKSIASEKVYLGWRPGGKSLSLYPVERWQALAEAWKDERRFPGTKLMMEAQRLFFANLEPAALDKVGRVLIPASFRERVGLVKEAVVLGVSDKIEIWTREALEESDAKAIELFEAALAAEAQAGASEAGLRLPHW
jgi:MraZ protein